MLRNIESARNNKYTVKNLMYFRKWRRKFCRLLQFVRLGTTGRPVPIHPSNSFASPKALSHYNLPISFSLNIVIIHKSLTRHPSWFGIAVYTRLCNHTLAAIVGLSRCLKPLIFVAFHQLLFRSGVITFSLVYLFFIKFTSFLFL